MTILSETRQLKDTVLHLDGSVTDKTNYGNDGTLNGGMSIVDGAFVFDGVDDYVSVADYKDDQGTDFSYSLFFSLDDHTATREVLFAHNSYGNGVMCMSHAGVLYVYIKSPNEHIQYTIPSFADDVFYHLVLTKKQADSYAKLFINGEEVAATAQQARGGTDPTAALPLLIGAQVGYGNLTGKIKSFRAFPRAITSTEARELYNATARPDIAGTVLHLRPETGLVDQSGTQDPGTYNGGMGVTGRRYVFDGSDDWIDTGVDSAGITDGDYSISAWVRTTTTAGTTRIIHDWHTQRSFLLWIASGNIQYYVGGGTSTLTGNISTSFTAYVDEWTHLVIHHVASTNTITLYINGSQAAQTTYTGTAGTTGANLEISDTSQTFNGDMGEIVVIPSAITAAEVLTLYEGVPGYEPPLPVRQIPDTVLHLEASSGERDLSNHCNYGTFNGTNIAEDSTDTEFVFNGTDDAIDLSDDDSLEVQEHSIEAWVYLGDTGNNGLFARENVTSDGYLWEIRNQKLSFAYYDSATRGFYSDTDNVPLNEWTHVVGTWDRAAGLITYYINGELTSTDSTPTADITHATRAAVVGERQLVSTDSFNGSLDGVRLIKRVLTATEVALQFNKGVRGYRPVGLLGGEVLALHPSRHDVGVLPDTVLQLDGKTGVTDQSPMGNDGTYNGGMGVTDGKFVFDGIDDNISCPIVTPTSWTLAARINSDNLSANRRLALYVGDGGSNGFGIASSGNVTGRISVLFGGVAWNDSASSYTAGVDTHIVATWDGTTLTIYKDGSSVLSSTPTAPITPTGQVTVGDDNAANSAHIGTVDDIRILDRALSATEVTTLFNNDISDESGNGNHGTLTNGAYVGESDEIVFDGVNDLVNFPDQTLPTGVTDLSVSLWCKADDTAAEYRAFTYNTNDVYISIRINQGGTADRIFVLVYDGADSTGLTTDAYPVTEWNHIAVTATEGDRYDLYINGIVVASDTSFGANFGVSSGSPTYNNIGAARDNTITFLGSIKDPRIFNRALTAAEVAFLASEAEVEVPNTKGSVLSIVPSYDDWGNATLNALDFSGNGNVGTLTSMTTADWVADTSEGGTRALDFDGSDDYALFGAKILDGASTFTLAAWVRPDSFTNNGYIFGNSNSAATESYYMFLRASPAGSIDVQFGDGSTLCGDSTNDGTVVPTGSWSFVAAVVDASNITRYLDGVQVGTIDSHSCSGGVVANGNDYIGNINFNNSGPQASRYFDGDIDDVYVWDRALSLDEIKALASTRNYFDCPIITANLFGDAVKMLMGQTH